MAATATSDRPMLRGEERPIEGIGPAVGRAGGGVWRRDLRREALRERWAMVECEQGRAERGEQLESSRSSIPDGDCGGREQSSSSSQAQQAVTTAAHTAKRPGQRREKGGSRRSKIFKASGSSPRPRSPRTPSASHPPSRQGRQHLLPTLRGSRIRSPPTFVELTLPGQS